MYIWILLEKNNSSSWWFVRFVKIAFEQKLSAVSINMQFKALDTFDICQRPVFSHGAFELNWSLKLRENNERKNTLVTQVMCFQMLQIFLRLQLRSWIPFIYYSEKLLLSQKLCYFRGSGFSQCFILPTTLHCWLPSKFLCCHYLCKCPVLLNKSFLLLKYVQLTLEWSNNAVASNCLFTIINQ